MVSKKLLKEYHFDCIEDYFNYVLEFYENDQKQQCIDSYNKLSEKQKNHFFDFVDASLFWDELDNDCVGETIVGFLEYIKE